MDLSKKSLAIRWLYLILGVFSMLFAGVIYAWSILKAPLETAFGWTASELSLNFTITMCFFCLGGVAGSILAERAGVKASVILGGTLSAIGFVLTSALSGNDVIRLYLFYGMVSGSGIGIAYNTIISTVGAWFPDKKGVCSGCLMMGFGASTLLLGNLSSALFDFIGWRKTYFYVGIAMGIAIILTGILLEKPDAALMRQKGHNQGNGSTGYGDTDYTPKQMLCRPSFWRVFLCLVCLSTVGSSVISFARDMSLSVGASTAVATMLVGVLSVCNGFGRIITGALFDALGRRVTMILANLIAVCAAGVALVSVSIGSLPMCIVSLCLTGISYGSCPTLSSSVTSEFYGKKHFSSNFSVMNFNLMAASTIAAASGALLSAYGNYAAPFALLLTLSLTALILNIR